MSSFHGRVKWTPTFTVVRGRDRTACARAKESMAAAAAAGGRWRGIYIPSAFSLFPLRFQFSFSGSLSLSCPLLSLSLSLIHTLPPRHSLPSPPRSLKRYSENDEKERDRSCLARRLLSVSLTLLLAPSRGSLSSRLLLRVFLLSLSPVRERAWFFSLFLRIEFKLKASERETTAGARARSPPKFKSSRHDITILLGC